MGTASVTVRSASVDDAQAICDEDVTAPACQSFISPGSGAAGSAPEERVISRSESRLSAIVTATGENGISRLPFVQQITDYQYSLSPADEATPRLQKRGNDWR